MAMRLLVWRQL